MTLLMPHIASRMFNTPLMIDAGKLAAILAGLGGRIVEGGVELGDIAAIEHSAFAAGRPSEQLGRLGDRLGRARARDGGRMFDQVGGTAIIPIEGTLIHKGAFLGQSSGETSYEGLQAQISAARRDASVRGALFEVDTFGGEGAGLFDTAHMIAELSREKPTLAIVNDFAYSAGYALASAARQIVLGSAGGVGSIGVVTMHLDHSKRLERAGTKVTVIHSGKHKADGHPFGELPPDVAAKIQNRVDAMRDEFAAMVGQFRGPRLSKAAALATEADVFYGEAAVKAGLADGVARPSEAFSQFVSLIG
ncbi:S49 family peptidase [Bradyrhizobium sp. CCBAU 11434]|uniref:S49 family peptidase n=1 Tax=Bradyrhizobium sp. CCBAU 11434 TaxID=1630885 RepID=UPI0023068888|nr:S49 family peptidase [Bradyrhizobium sp. CCBAU 11434]